MEIGVRDRSCHASDRGRDCAGLSGPARRAAEQTGGETGTGLPPAARGQHRRYPVLVHSLCHRSSPKRARPSREWASPLSRCRNAPTTCATQQKMMCECAAHQTGDRGAGWQAKEGRGGPGDNWLMGHLRGTRVHSPTERRPPRPGGTDGGTNGNRHVPRPVMLCACTDAHVACFCVATEGRQAR